MNDSVQRVGIVWSKGNSIKDPTIQINEQRVLELESASNDCLMEDMEATCAQKELDIGK
jgi:hypothetical protein